MNNGRQLSLDVLRGLDLFMLVALQPVLRSFLIELDSEILNNTLLYQLDHAQWEGFRAWDLVMPLFLFMSGVTMPYSLPKYKMKNGNDNRAATARRLFITGIALLLVGAVAGIWQPIIKRIWTASMTIYSAGWCYLLLAFFYWWIDVKGHSRKWNWLLYYGCNAITAYIIGETINFRSIASSLLHGTEQSLDGWYPVLLTACNSVIIFFILKIMYRNKIFPKV